MTKRASDTPDAQAEDAKAGENKLIACDGTATMRASAKAMDPSNSKEKQEINRHEAIQLMGLNLRQLDGLAWHRDKDAPRQSGGSRA